MPGNVIFICLIMNSAISAFLMLGGIAILSRNGLTSGAVFIFGIGAVCGYTAYIINKLRRYLHEETRLERELERELRVAKLRTEIDQELAGK